MPGGKLTAVLLWDGSATCESDLYLCTSKLIWPRSAKLSSMKIRDLWARVSSSKPLLKIGTERSKSCRGPQATLAAGTSTYITANHQMKLRAIE